MRFFILFLVFFHASFLIAQSPLAPSGTIDGKVFDSISKSPLEYAAIRILKSEDSSVVSSIFTDTDGSFVLDQVPLGKLIVRISAPGYRDKFIPNIVLTPQKTLRKLGNVSLVSLEKSIDEVVIVKERNPLTIGLDKKVYNVGDDISVNGGSANDVLNNVPSVEIDQDGKVSLRGDGNVTILIDGKPSSLSGGNGKSLLDGIPAGSIERIEIVTNPSAKYDPDGTSGIINIVLKKNIKRGLNGNVNLSAGSGNAYNGGAGLSLRNSRYNIYGNYSYDYKEGYRNNFSDLTQSNSLDTVLFRQRRYGSDSSVTHTAKIGMDIYLKDRNTFSWNATGNIGERQRYGDQENFRRFSDADTIGLWHRVARDPSDNQNLDFGLNYNWEFKEDKGSIDWNAYQSFGRASNQGYYNQYYLFPGDTTSLDQRLFNTENTNVTTLSMDVVRIFKSKWRTESGLKMIHRNMSVYTNSDARDSLGNYVADTLADFDYTYTERIYSAYGIVASTYKKWKYQAGVRLEKSYQEPNLVSENKAYVNDYFNFFPSATIRYGIKKGSEFSFGYSRRINRPNSENLNPFTSYADPYNLRRGNPELKPEYIHSMDLGYELMMKKITFTATAYQRYSTNVINRVKVFYPDGTSAGTFANIDNSISTGGEIIFQLRPLPIFRTMISVNGNYIKYMDNNSTLNWNREGFVLGGKFSASLDLMNKTLTLQLNGRYSAPSVTPSGKANPRGSMDFSMDKTFKDGKWGIGLRVTDIFNTQGFRFYVDQPGNQQSVEFKWETRRLYFNIRYKFGRTDYNDKKQNPQPGGGGGGFDF
jgi:outer membrane receptor protein involved in Fe transport